MSGSPNFMMTMKGTMHTTTLIAAFACAGTCAAAQPAAIAQGERIAAGGTEQGVAACAGCHGAKGEGNLDFPRLAGTGKSYLQAQLDAFASGARQNPLMQPIAQKLAPDERAAVASYYSQLPPSRTAEPAASPKPSETGGWLATRGRWADQLPACAQCHGPTGAGVGEHFPPLAGLSPSYIAAQLKAWKAGARPPGPLSLMPTIARKLSDDEITAVADYYGALTAKPSASAAAEPRPAASDRLIKGGKP